MEQPANTQILTALNNLGVSTAQGIAEYAGLHESTVRKALSALAEDNQVVKLTTEPPFNWTTNPDHTENLTVQQDKLLLDEVLAAVDDVLGLTTDEISFKTGIPIPDCKRILEELENQGKVDRPGSMAWHTAKWRATKDETAPAEEEVVAVEVKTAPVDSGFFVEESPEPAPAEEVETPEEKPMLSWAEVAAEFDELKTQRREIHSQSIKIATLKEAQTVPGFGPTIRLVLQMIIDEDLS